MDEHKTGLILASIVAIVAIVGLVLMLGVKTGGATGALLADKQVGAYPKACVQKLFLCQEEFGPRDARCGDTLNECMDAWKAR